jgi:hypothetical protein
MNCKAYDIDSVIKWAETREKIVNSEWLMEIIRKLPRQETNTFYKIKNIANAILKEKKYNFEIPIFLPIGYMGELVEITKKDIYPNRNNNDGKIVFGKNDNQQVIYSISDLSEEEYDSENYIESLTDDSSNDD